METIVANLTGKVRYAIENGVRYLVAPATFLRNQVLAGSQGALLYPADEISKSVAAWNGIPLTHQHPTDPITNQPLSATANGVLDRQGLGEIRNARLDGGLKADLWFDVDKTKRVEPSILAALNAGHSLELSTGLYTTNHPTHGTHNGRSYTHIARDYRPDHLAILHPTNVGACSVRDGCGVLVNTGGLPMVETWQEVALASTHATVNAGINQPRCPHVGHYLAYGSGTGKGDAHNAAKLGFAALTETPVDRSATATFGWEEVGGDGKGEDAEKLTGTHNAALPVVENWVEVVENCRDPLHPGPCAGSGKGKVAPVTKPAKEKAEKAVKPSSVKKKSEPVTGTKATLDKAHAAHQQAMAAVRDTKAALQKAKADHAAATSGKASKQSTVSGSTKINDATATMKNLLARSLDTTLKPEHVESTVKDMAKSMTHDELRAVAKGMGIATSHPTKVKTTAAMTKRVTEQMGGYMRGLE